MTTPLTTAADNPTMTCSTCKNFRLHYIKYSRGNYTPLSYGHCVKPRLKKRYVSDPACAYWVQKSTI